MVGSYDNTIEALREAINLEPFVAQVFYYGSKHGMNRRIPLHVNFEIFDSLVGKNDETPATLIEDLTEQLRERYQAIGLYKGEASFKEQLESIRKSVQKQIPGRPKG